MTEIPKGPPNAELRSGDQCPGLQCKGCGLGIVMDGDLDGLPESFEATCLMCGHRESYRKDEIQTLTEVLKH
jgi:cytochrome c-type biogenesis protein CcmE